MRAGLFPAGLKLAQSNAKKLNIEHHVEYIVGVSPDDVEKNINSELDFVFIDGGHFGDQPRKDFDAIKNKIGKKSVLFFHDNFNNPAIQTVVKSAEDYFGAKAIDLETHWHLTVLPMGITMSDDYIMPCRT